MKEIAMTDTGAFRIRFIVDIDAPDAEQEAPTEETYEDGGSLWTGASISLGLFSSVLPDQDSEVRLAAPPQPTLDYPEEFEACRLKVRMPIVARVRTAKMVPVREDREDIECMILCTLILDSYHDLIATFGYMTLGYRQFQNRISYERDSAEVVGHIRRLKGFLS